MVTRGSKVKGFTGIRRAFSFSAKKHTVARRHASLSPGMPPGGRSARIVPAIRQTDKENACRTTHPS